MLAIITRGLPNTSNGGGDGVARDTVISGTAGVGSGLYWAWRTVAGTTAVRATVSVPWNLVSSRSVKFLHADTAEGINEVCHPRNWHNGSLIGTGTWARYKKHHSGPFDCCQKCVGEPACVAWVQSESESRCWLKDNSNSTRASVGRVSGVVRTRQVETMIGVSSSGAAGVSTLDRPSSSLVPKALSARVVLHHTRNPLVAISTLMSMSEERWQLASTRTWRANEPASRPPTATATTAAQSSSSRTLRHDTSYPHQRFSVDAHRRRLTDALKHWVTWNLVLELVSSAHYAVENITARSLCRQMINLTCTESHHRAHALDDAGIGTDTATFESIVHMSKARKGLPPTADSISASNISSAINGYGSSVAFITRSRASHDPSHTKSFHSRRHSLHSATFMSSAIQLPPPRYSQRCSLV